VLVDASTGAASNGSAAPPNAAPGAWLVNVGEGDERSLQLQEVIDAYNSGVITAETYLWKEGMADWQSLSEIPEIVEALNQASGASAAPPYDRSSSRDAAQPRGGAGGPAAARSSGTARRDPGRAGDMFARAPVEEEVATSVPPHVLAQQSQSFGGAPAQAVAQRSGGMMGTRDEQSVLFSLNALTGGQKPSVAPADPMTGSARGEDSGLIDLNALARAQQSRTADEASLQLAAPSPFMFPAALGTVEAPQAQQAKSSMPFFIGGGIGVAGLAIAVAIFAGGKKDEVPPMPAEAALSAAPIPTPEVPAATAPAETAAPADSAPGKVVKKAVGGGRPASKAAAATTPAVATPATPLPPTKPKSPCGCAPSDLQCQIRCSATGH
jgi:hypothetical protein